MKIKSVENIVKNILENIPATRGNDNLLILEFVKNTDRNEKQTFERVMQQTNVSFESITRARRNIQNKYPKLKNADAEHTRLEQEAEYYEHYKNS